MESDFFLRGLKYYLQDRGVSSKFSSHSIFRVQPINAAFRGARNGRLIPRGSSNPPLAVQFLFFAGFWKNKKSGKRPRFAPFAVKLYPKERFALSTFPLCLSHNSLFSLWLYAPFGG
ncbi:MAG: hypothetical protein CRN43_21905 [Candidatus Nephrothrix sp. EaCA]|nr:MAG: hypothetical protein CRN43_21905 [Candidatus Nephrothrix sp. EaCA]